MSSMLDMHEFACTHVIIHVHVHVNIHIHVHVHVHAQVNVHVHTELVKYHILSMTGVSCSDDV